MRSPFQANYGRRPRQPHDALNPYSRLTDAPLHVRPKVKDHITVDDMRLALYRSCRQSLQEAKQVQKRKADLKRRPAYDYKVGDRVLVSRKALTSREDREMIEVTGRKLGPLFIGPYKVLDVFGNTLLLDLPRSMRAYTRVNVTFVRPYRADGSFGRPDEPPPIFLEGEVFFRPEAIKRYEVQKAKGKRQLHRYLVKFVGYTDSWNKWLEPDDLHLCEDMLKRFWEARGETPPKGVRCRRWSRESFFLLL